MDHNRLRHNKYLPMTRQWSPNYLWPPSQYVLKDPRSSLQRRTNDPPAFELYVNQTWWRLSPVSSLITVDLYISRHLSSLLQTRSLLYKTDLRSIPIECKCKFSLLSITLLASSPGVTQTMARSPSRLTIDSHPNHQQLDSPLSQFSVFSLFLSSKNCVKKSKFPFPTKIPLKRSSGGYFSALTALTTQVSCYPN